MFCIQEQFGEATTDFHKCLELQEKHLESDDRLIAETYPYYAKLRLHNINYVIGKWRSIKQVFQTFDLKVIK